MKGWPKGKPRGPMDSERKRKFAAAGARARLRQKRRAVEVSSGRTLGAGLNEDYRPARAHIDVSPAAWRTVATHIGDCEYVEDGLDEALLRALHERVVYAGSTCCHHEAPFHDVVANMLVAIDKEFQKSGKRASRGLLKGMRAPDLLASAAARLPKPAPKPSESREGKSLLDVVSEMFPERSADD